MLNRRDMVRGVAAAAGGVILGGAVELGTARPALADGTPTVYTRDDWGARRPRYAAEILNRKPDHIVIHHTATANVGDTSKERAFALSRAIQRYHMDSNRWNDIGQQLTISRGGYVMEGRNRTLTAIAQRKHLVGAHVANHNTHTIGVESEGTYTSATPPADLLVALVKTCAWLCLVYDLNPGTAIVGHRDYNATQCPGDELYSLLPKLRVQTAERTARLKQAHAVSERERQGAVEIPERNHPTFPDVPQGERVREHYHGPALGERDPHH